MCLLRIKISMKEERVNISQKSQNTHIFYMNILWGWEGREK